MSIRLIKGDLLLVVIFGYLWGVSFCFSAVPTIERQALEALYNSTGGISWSTNTNWLVDDPCENSWYGIRCDSGNTTIQTIQLMNNNLVGTLPPELSFLPNLFILDLCYNQLDGPIPPEFGNLSSIILLDLHGNQLGGTIPTELSTIPNLQWITLYSNNIEGNIPTELGAMSNLFSLQLYLNELSGTIPTELGNLSNLAFLLLGHNHLNGLIPTELGSLTNLQSLTLNNNHLEGTIPTEIGSLNQLQDLVLNSNVLTGSIPSQLTNLTMLLDDSSDLRWNALYTSDNTLRTFLNSKQMGGDWESTQTVPPTDLVAQTIANDTIRLDWTPITYIDNDGGYEIHQSTTSGGPYTFQDITIDKTISTLDIPGLTPGINYYFVIKTVTYPHSNNNNQIFSEQTPELTVTLVVPVFSPVGLVLIIAFVSMILFKPVMFNKRR